MSYQTERPKGESRSKGEPRRKAEAEEVLPPSSERVPRSTARHVNARIYRQTELMLCYYAARLDEVEERLEELDREWDIERTLEANAATVSLLGLVMGAMVSRKWFVLPGVVSAFLLQHALQGWCPPVPAFRRFGYRTRKEIDEERYALKALRGDFEKVSACEGEGPSGSAERADAALHAAMD
jgi:hypothetical protein